MLTIRDMSDGEKFPQKSKPEVVVGGSRHDAFRRHLETCQECGSDDREMCDAGYKLLRHAME